MQVVVPELVWPSRRPPFPSRSPRGEDVYLTLMWHSGAQVPDTHDQALVDHCPGVSCSSMLPVRGPAHGAPYHRCQHC